MVFFFVGLLIVFRSQAKLLMSMRGGGKQKRGLMVETVWMDGIYLSGCLTDCSKVPGMPLRSRTCDQVLSYFDAVYPHRKRPKPPSVDYARSI